MNALTSSLDGGAVTCPGAVHGVPEPACMTRPAVRVTAGAARTAGEACSATISHRRISSECEVIIEARARRVGSKYASVVVVLRSLFDAVRSLLDARPSAEMSPGMCSCSGSIHRNIRASIGTAGASGWASPNAEACARPL